MNWIKTEDRQPNEGEKVCVMTYDADGFNATFTGGNFIVDGTNEAVKPENVAYWCAGENFTTQIKKKCGMCGRI